MVKGTILYSQKGEEIIIINPGELNKHEGPDIKNVILSINGEIDFGSVECHINASSWYSHNHQNDKNYNNVILHVVRKFNLNHQYPNIPTIVIKPSKIYRDDCTLNKVNIRENVTETIQYFSFKRWQRRLSSYSGFHNKKNKLRELLIQDSFAILGAGGNRDSFLKLARNIDNNLISDFNTIEIENYLLEISFKNNIIWKKRGIRPYQQPHNRIKLAAELIRYYSSFNFDGRMKFSDIQADLINSCPSVSGKGIQTELFGNVIIPFIASRFLFRNNIEEYSYYFTIRNKLKLPITYNKFTKRFKDTIPPSELKRFSISQGLVEIDYELCTPRKCNLCPLKNNYGNIK